MSEEQFIIEFYSCDNEEQFLKDVYHNLNILKQENQQLKEQLDLYKSVIDEAIKYIEDKMELSKECPVELLEILNKYKANINGDNENE